MRYLNYLEEKETFSPKDKVKKKELAKLLVKFLDIKDKRSKQVFFWF